MQGCCSVWSSDGAIDSSCQTKNKHIYLKPKTCFCHNKIKRLLPSTSSQVIAQLGSTSLYSRRGCFIFRLIIPPSIIPQNIWQNKSMTPQIKQKTKTQGQTSEVLSWSMTEELERRQNEDMWRVSQLSLTDADVALDRWGGGVSPNPPVLIRIGFSDPPGGKPGSTTDPRPVCGKTRPGSGPRRSGLPPVLGEPPTPPHAKRSSRHKTTTNLTEQWPSDTDSRATGGG